MGRVVLDSSVAIAAERGHLDFGALIAGSEVLLPAVVLAELLTTVALAESDDDKLRRREIVAIFEESAKLLEFGEAEAEVLANLRAHCLKQGRKRGENDLMIAAHAVAERAILMTTDKRANFSDLPGVIVQHV